MPCVTRMWCLLPVSKGLRLVPESNFESFCGKSHRCSAWKCWECMAYHAIYAPTFLRLWWPLASPRLWFWESDAWLGRDVIMPLATSLNIACTDFDVWSFSWASFLFMSGCNEPKFSRSKLWLPCPGVNGRSRVMSRWIPSHISEAKEQIVRIKELMLLWLNSSINFSIFDVLFWVL